MKNKLISLFFLLCVLFSIGDVFAYDAETIFEKGRDGHTAIPTITCPKYPTQFKNSIYYATNTADVNEKYYMYCADPFVNASLYLKVDHILMGAESTKKHLDYGVLVIMQDLGEQAFSTSNPNRDNDYEATSQALRMFVNALWGIPYRISSNGNSLFYSYIQTAYRWIKDDPEMTEYYKKLNGNQDPKRILDLYRLSEDPSKMFKYSGGAVAVETKAKELLEKGMAAAVRYMEGSITMPEVTINRVSSSEVTETTVGSLTQYEQDIVVAITIDGFNNGSYEYYGAEADYPSTTSISEIGYSFDKPADLTALSPMVDILSSDANKINLVDFLKANSPATGNPDDEYKTIYIAYKVKNQSSDSTSGCPAGFSIKHAYDDTMLLNGAMLMAKLSGGLDSTDFQRFFMFSGDPVEDKYNIPLSMCPAGCKPQNSFPQMCDDDPTNVTMNSGNTLAEYEYREGIYHGNLNIEKCILKNSDANGSSHKLVDSLNAGILHDNPYCSVYCKEDYKFSVPYKVTVDNGRYFKLSMEIKGQMDCYSTKIDSAALYRDLRAAQAEMVTNYNLMLRTKNLLDAKADMSDPKYWDDGTTETCYKYTSAPILTNPLTGQISCGIPSITTNGSVTPKKYAYNGTYYQLVLQNSAYYTVATSSDVYIYDYTDKNAITASTIDDSTLEFGEIESKSTGSCSLLADGTCGCSGASCDITTPEDAYEKYLEDNDITQEKLEEYKTLYEAAVNKLYHLVDLFNGCMADDNYDTMYLNDDMYRSWQMVYEFNPEIKYSYREPEPNDYSYDKWIKDVQALDCNGKSCDVMIPTKDTAGNVNQKVIAQYCGQPSTSGTRCIDNEPVYNIFNNNAMNVVEWCDGAIDASYNCTGTLKTSITSSDYTFYPVVVCNDSGCENYVDKRNDPTNTTPGVKVTNMNYVHKVAVAEGKYDTARVYYQFSPSGSIKVSNVDIPEASLIPGLPVGLYTQPDVYFYILTLNNIGMYYSNQSNRLGRIYSEKGLSSVLNNNSQTINGEELKGNQYACTYEITSCTDSAGVVHHPIECNTGESWDRCKKRLCPTTSSYCVKQAESYYVCNTTSYDSSCVEYSDRDSAVAAATENYNCCPNCTIMCVGPCVMDTGNWNNEEIKAGVEFKPITPEIVNPNDREMGYNWYWDPTIANPINVLVAEKAGNTITEIKKRAELNDVESLTPDDQAELQMVEEYKVKVKLTPEMANYIRNYNDTNEDKGGYSNDTLECFDYPVTQYRAQDTCEKAGYYWDETNGCQMKKVFCFSKFMSDLETNYSAEVQMPNRANAYSAALNNSYVNVRNYTGNNVIYNDATTRPIMVINDYWTIYQYTVMDINGDKIPDIGPSWK
ncbi:MAG: hypothetical protein IJO63_04915 [Bacilli bacterium]|nr:hypothetical protein [Bacilli bacterium]